MNDYVCEHCGAAYILKTNRDDHVAAMHPGVAQQINKMSQAISQQGSTMSTSFQNFNTLIGQYAKKDDARLVQIRELL